MIICKPELDAEDATTLVSFLDVQIPQVSDRGVALALFEIREEVHRSMGSYGADIPKGVRPS